MTNRGNELIHFAKLLSRRCVHGRVVATCMLRPVSILSLR